MSVVSQVKRAQLSELRAVSQEVGGYEVARRMPIEVRRWWIDEMRSDREDESVRVDPDTGKRIRTKFVK